RVRQRRLRQRVPRAGGGDRAPDGRPRARRLPGQRPQPGGGRLPRRHRGRDAGGAGGREARGEDVGRVRPRRADDAAARLLLVGRARGGGLRSGGRPQGPRGLRAGPRALEVLLLMSADPSPIQRTIALGADFWNDSCDPRELAEAVAEGATGATSNPVIVCTALKGDPGAWVPVLDALTSDFPAAGEDELAWKLIESIGVRAAALL